MQKMDKISPIKQRILQYIEYKKISKEFFCQKTGISTGNLKGKSLLSEIGGTQIVEILSIFEEISPEWLLTGNGTMIKNITKTSNTELANQENGIDNSLANIQSEKTLLKLVQIFQEQLILKDKIIVDLLKHQDMLLTNISKLTDK